MMTYTPMTVTATHDAELVAASLAGNREAFGQIVARYQSLICSLAYSATGNLAHSEDLAQDTFVTAWRQLRDLREPAKLRSWLCGIGRNSINNWFRRQGREPSHAAAELEALHDAPSLEPLPLEQTIGNEETAILWRSLERIPLAYREPLVLFYREQHSIEKVAAALELSEDAVKQRLSRGRKMLHEQVLSFVEGALERTNPGKAFTLAVLAALPVVLTTSAKAATLGAAAAQGTAAAKTAAGLGALNIVFGPLVGFIGPWLQYRMFLAAARTETERANVKRYFRKMAALIFGFGLILFLLISFGGRFIQQYPGWFAALLILLMAGYVFIAVRMGMTARQLFRQLQAERAALGVAQPAEPRWEYRTKTTFLGWPLVHICMRNFAERQEPVKAWFAAGDTAIGGLFAFGGIAIAPFSLGGISVGLLAWGGMAIGGFALGGFALGVWAFGGFALAWQAFGGCALGWQSAMGGLAVAREYALGGVAHALQVNNDAARQFIEGQPFFRYMQVLARHISWLNLLWILPLIGWWRLLAKAKTTGNPT